VGYSICMQPFLSKGSHSRNKLHSDLDLFSKKAVQQHIEQGDKTVSLSTWSHAHLCGLVCC